VQKQLLKEQKEKELALLKAKEEEQKRKEIKAQKDKELLAIKEQLKNEKIRIAKEKELELFLAKSKLIEEQKQARLLQEKELLKKNKIIEAETLAKQNAIKQAQNELFLRQNITKKLQNEKEEKEKAIARIKAEIASKNELRKKLKDAMANANVLKQREIVRLEEIKRKKEEKERLAAKHYSIAEVINKLNSNTIQKETFIDILIRSVKKVLDSKNIAVDMVEVEKIILDTYHKKIDNYEADLYLKQLAMVIEE
jgi:hypothetical protein